MFRKQQDMNPWPSDNESYTLSVMPQLAWKRDYVYYTTVKNVIFNQSCQKDNIARRRQPYVNSNNK